MITKVKFGECLHLLLSALDISSNKLSKGINVDSSLVSRWLHEQRIPSYHSGYLEKIALFFSESILNSFQEQRLNEVINGICVDIDKRLDTKDRIMKVLLESQGFSLECKKKDSSKTAPNFKAFQTVDMSKEDKIILGSKNISSAVLSLFEEAVKEKDNTSNTLYISFNNNLDTINIDESFMSWLEVVLKILKNGWTVIFLFKICHNQNRIINLINLSKPLLDTGRFLPYYYKTYDEISLGSATAVIPGIGALSCISTNVNLGIDCALFIRTKVGVDILRDNFNSLVFTSAKPLVKHYTLDESLDFNASIVESEERSGNRFIFKDNLSILTIPDLLFPKLLGKLSLTNNESLKELKLYKRRSKAFLLNLQHYEHFDIYTLDSIQRIIKHKQFSFSCLNVMHTVDLQNEDIIMLLQNIIDLLKNYDNYKIALVNDTVNENDTLFSYIIKEKHQVHIESSKAKLSIEEPMIINALEERFKEIWEHIAPIDKDKGEIIKWLNYQIELLKKNEASSKV